MKSAGSKQSQRCQRTDHSSEFEDSIKMREVWGKRGGWVNSSLLNLCVKASQRQSLRTKFQPETSRGQKLIWIITQLTIQLLLRGAHTPSRAAVSFSAHPVTRLEAPKEVAHWGYLIRAGQRDVPFHVTVCSPIKPRGKRKRECSRLWHFCSQVIIVLDGIPLSWKQINSCLPMRRH